MDYNALNEDIYPIGLKGSRGLLEGAKDFNDKQKIAIENGNLENADLFGREAERLLKLYKLAYNSSREVRLGISELEKTLYYFTEPSEK